MHLVWNSSIGRKLSFSFALVLLLGMTCAMLGLWRMKSLSNDTTLITAHWMQGQILADQLRQEANSTARGMVRLPIREQNRKATELVDLWSNNLNKRYETSKDVLVKYGAIAKSPEEREAFDQARIGVDKIYLGTSAYFDFLVANRTNPTDRAAAEAAKMHRAFQEGEKPIADLVEFNRRGALQAAAQANSNFKVSLTMVIAGILVSVLTGLALAVTITRDIKLPLLAVGDVVQAIGNGDLSMRLQRDRQDEIGELQESLAKTLVSLNTLMTRVRRSANSVSYVSAEIASATQNLGERTEESASSLAQTASSMSMLDTTVSNSNQAAASANQYATTAAGVASRGGEVVQKVVGNMENITQTSSKIAAIISVIDGIAFQTNILALNAAVEAARAGEQGRGFAVVASEVRSLAQRSAAAAKEIKELIVASVESVEAGSILVTNAGQTMAEIVESVQQVHHIITQITSVSDKQSDDIHAISHEILDIDRSTQQNAALVEQSFATAESLKAQAEQLLGTIAGFRLAENSAEAV